MKFISILIITFIAMQLIPLEKSNPKVDATLTLQAPQEVQKILTNSCYDCHSNETKWPWYSNVAPVSFYITNRINEGRKALNFSIWNEIDEETKVKRLQRAIITVKNGMMPKLSYSMVHEDTKLSLEEKKVLVEWFEKELDGKKLELFR
jgi:uncharacterized membrane protein